MNKINVLSLFNGMGTLRQAFHNLGISINSYYSSEIKTYANKLQQYHFPDVIQVGDIKKWRNWDIDFSSIDFIGSGSPCQDISRLGKMKGINGGNSILFYIFVDILNHVKKLNPNVKFLQENVASANKYDVDEISKSLGIYPVRINSNRILPHNRDRYYWTNIRVKNDLFHSITDIPQPKFKDTSFNDILTSGSTDSKYCNTLTKLMYNSFGHKDKLSDKAQIYLKSRQKFGITPIYEGDKPYLRLLNKIEMCRLQGFPDNYCNIISTRQACSLLGDGWTLPIIEHILSYYELPKQDI